MGVTEYHDAAHEAYRRLKWQEQNRPSQQEIEGLQKAEKQEQRRLRLARFRRSIA